MKRVYVAGPYSADNVLDVLNNIRDGQRAGLEVLLAGFAPFVPWLDFHFQLMLRDGEKLSVQDYYDYSMAWLEASDAVYVYRLRSDSKGVRVEIERALELAIPVYYSFSDLVEWEK
uniref:DUF7768 domain-containing protein n=1 Tax=viral metagenome TaxID=1070528 RepID=A0A6M3JTX8_9ZZZZ